MRNVQLPRYLDALSAEKRTGTRNQFELSCRSRGVFEAGTGKD